MICFRLFLEFNVVMQSKKIKCNMIQIVGIIVIFTKKLFRSWEVWNVLSTFEKFQTSLNLLLDHQILFCIIQICDRSEKDR
jgi:hypothetical protein